MLPFALSLIFALSNVFDGQAWRDLLAHPQLWPGLRLSLFTGAASATLALLVALLIVSAIYNTDKWHGLTTNIGAMLALPHLALAVGFGLLVMPSGVIARLVAALFTGWQSPPNWISTHDPWGVGLIVVLAIKEAPFIIWMLAGILNGPDVQRSFAGQRAAALSLGHSTGSIWLRVFLPQLLPKLVWPMVIVFVYAATVVDVALAIGPTQPPTLASVIWADINSELVASNARGQVGALFLSGAIALALFAAWALAKILAPSLRKFLVQGPSHWAIPSWLGNAKLKALMAFYFIVVMLLLFMSLAQLWPFPDLGPSISFAAWGRIFNTPQALITSLGLAFATSATALVLLIFWLETQPEKLDRPLMWLCLAILGLPAILVGLGQYRAFLNLGLTGTALGLFLAHLMPVTAYMFIVLQSPYRRFDPRWRTSAGGLMAGFGKFFWAIKLPLLKAPILAAYAIGFAVSFSQYIPAQLVGAGRFSTLPIEAVTLTSGNNRPLLAAFALLLAVPPFLVFVLAAHFSKSRWRPV